MEEGRKGKALTQRTQRKNTLQLLSGPAEVTERIGRVHVRTASERLEGDEKAPASEGGRYKGKRVRLDALAGSA